MKRSLTRWLPPILWAVLIFITSSMSAPISILPAGTLPAMKTVFIFGSRLDNIVWAASHIFLYAVLGFLLAGALRGQNRLHRDVFVAAFIITVLYGVTDEIHQIWVPERGFQVYDLLMNSLGALFGVTVCGLCAIKSQHKAKQDALLL